MNKDIERIDIINIIKKFDSSISTEFNILPFLIFFIGLIIIIIYLIKIEVNSNGKNWETNKCIPKYMFVSGFIEKEEDSTGVLDSTYTTFKKCIKKFGKKHKAKYNNN